MELREWANVHLNEPDGTEKRVRAILADPTYRERINGIADALNATRYRSAWLIQRKEIGF